MDMTKTIVQRSGRITFLNRISFIVTAVTRFVVSTSAASVDTKNFGSFCPMGRVMDWIPATGNDHCFLISTSDWLNND
jgi:hypothetical protein